MPKTSFTAFDERLVKISRMLAKQEPKVSYVLSYDPKTWVSEHEPSISVRNLTELNYCLDCMTSYIVDFYPLAEPQWAGSWERLLESISSKETKLDCSGASGNLTDWSGLNVRHSAFLLHPTLMYPPSYLNELFIPPLRVLFPFSGL